jgi:TIR domain
MYSNRDRQGQPALSAQRDIFLSHRSTDKDFVRQLAADIEAEVFQSRRLLTWLDEAEIDFGQSIPRMVNEGLEISRFIGLIMTPDYFSNESGWTDAEWHAALNVDPDNRRGRIIPLLVADCPMIPYLLRHLRMIDFRGSRYAQAFKELLRVLREEPLPRPVTYRGQLITSNGRIDRSLLVAERAVPEADPDAVAEKLYCNLLPVEQLPRYVYVAPITQALRQPRKDGPAALPSKQKIKEAIRSAQEAAGIEHPYMPAFRALEDMIVTFHDLEAPNGPFEPVIQDDKIDCILVKEFLQDEDDRKIIMSLLNMAISRHANKVGLVSDDTKNDRFFFPPKDGGPRSITWTPKKSRASRTVAKPCVKNGQVLFWRHLGAYLRMLFLANNFYLKITPTWVFTEDGYRVKGGPTVSRLAIRWTGAERNMQVLYHVRFWTTVLRTGAGPIPIKAGDQRIEISTIPAFIQLPYGIAGDQKDLLGLLDQEAPLIAQEEDELADREIEHEGLEAAALSDNEEEDWMLDNADEEGDLDVE